jgi:non-ribosomal peptide synthetase component F/pimeloyl-ACP methyl ester carboxylesterase
MREFPALPRFATGLLLHELAETATVQNAQLSLSFGEFYTPEFLRASWQSVAAAHDVLRTSFKREKAITQRVHDAAEAPWRVLDWKDIPPTELPSRWASLLAEDAAMPVDLDTPPLLRFTCLVLPNGHCHILATFPRFLISENDLYIILSDWLATLEDRPPQPRTPFEPVDSTDAVEWWKNYLGEGVPAFVIDHFPIAPPVEQNHEQKLVLERDETVRLREFCRSNLLDLDTVILAAWSLVVKRVARLADGVLLAATNGNFAPKRITIDETLTVADWLKSFADSERERAENALLGLDQLVPRSQKTRKPAIPAITVDFRPPTLNDRIHDNLPRWINVDAQLHERLPFPFLFELREGDKLTLRIESRETPASEMRRLLERTANVLDEFVTNPAKTLKEIDVLFAAEREAISLYATTAASRVPKIRIEEDITDFALSHGSAIAVEGPDEGAALSYADMASYAGSLAEHLRKAGLAEGWNIATCLTPTQWIPVAILGVLQAGDTCVPLDHTASKAWLVRKVDEYDVELVICDSQTALSFEGTSKKLLIIDQQWEEISANQSKEFSPSAKAVIALTGSEDEEAPVLKSYDAGLLAFVCKQSAQLWKIEPGSRVPLLAKAGTAAYLEELFVTLGKGGTVVLANDASELAARSATHARFTADQWKSWIDACRLDPGLLPLSLGTVLVEAGPHLAASRTLWHEMTGGAQVWIQFASPTGFSGTGVRWISTDEIYEADDLPIGSATQGVEALLNDASGHPLAPHHAGQIEFILPTRAEPIAGLRAWRDGDGILHPIFVDKPKPAPKLIVSIPEPEPEPQPVPTTPAPAPEVAWEPLVTLCESPDGPTLYLVHDGDGSPERYRALAAQFEGEWTLKATTARGLVKPSQCHRTVEEEATDLVRAMRESDPDGPYHLFGYGFGATLALEISRQLLSAGHGVDFLVLSSPSVPEAEVKGGWLRSLQKNLTGAMRGKADPVTESTPVALAHVNAFRAYKAVPLPGDACVILGSDASTNAEKDWSACIPDAFFEQMPCAFGDILREPGVKRLAAILRECAQEPGSGE